MKSKHYIFIFLGLFLAIVFAIAFPSLIPARKSANEGSAITSIRTWLNAQEKIEAEKNISCATFKQLNDFGHISEPFKLNNEKNGYRFIIKKNGDDCKITAIPKTEDSGTWSFYLSLKEKTIRFSSEHNKQANKNSELLVK